MLNSALEKLSILLFYRRMSGGGAPKFNAAVTACMVITIAYTISFETSLFAMCTPFEALWKQTDPTWRQNHTFKCGNQGAHILGASLVNIPMDFILAVLPITLLWDLNMPTPRKISLGILFGTSFLPTIAAVMRSRSLYKGYYQDWDFTCEFSPEALPAQHHGLILTNSQGW